MAGLCNLQFIGREYTRVYPTHSLHGLDMVKLLEVIAKFVDCVPSSEWKKLFFVGRDSFEFNGSRVNDLYWGEGETNPELLRYSHNKYGNVLSLSQVKKKTQSCVFRYFRYLKLRPVTVAFLSKLYHARFNREDFNEVFGLPSFISEATEEILRGANRETWAKRITLPGSVAKLYPFSLLEVNQVQLCVREPIVILSGKMIVPLQENNLLLIAQEQLQAKVVLRDRDGEVLVRNEHLRVRERDLHEREKKLQEEERRLKAWEMHIREREELIFLREENDNEKQTTTAALVVEGDEIPGPSASKRARVIEFDDDDGDNDYNWMSQRPQRNLVEDILDDDDDDDDDEEGDDDHNGLNPRQLNFTSPTRQNIIQAGVKRRDILWRDTDADAHGRDVTLSFNSNNEILRDNYL